MGACVPQLPAPYPRRGTLEVAALPPRLPLRGCHPLRPRTSTGVRVPAGGKAATPNNPTSPVGFPTGFSLGYGGFGRPYSRHRISLSFPAGTEMFHFPAFPPLIGAPGVNPRAGGPIRGSRDQRLRAPPPGLSQLATPFFGSRAQASTGRGQRSCGRWWPHLKHQPRSGNYSPRS